MKEKQESFGFSVTKASLSSILPSKALRLGNFLS
jgi:hypothetical protein